MGWAGPFVPSLPTLSNSGVSGVKTFYFLCFPKAADFDMLFSFYE
jgi:hypothetical protein